MNAERMDGGAPLGISGVLFVGNYSLKAQIEPHVFFGGQF